MSCSKSGGTSEVRRAVFNAAAERVSIILACEEPAAFRFVQCLADLFNSRNERCYVVAGSDALCQRIDAATGIQAVALHRAFEESPLKPSGTSLPRAIVVVSSTIDFVAMAKLLPQLLPTDQLFFVGQQLRHDANRALLLPALLAIDEIFRHQLPPSSNDNLAVDEASRGVPISSADKSVYNPRESERLGLFWLCVTDDAFERAVIGVSHQLRRHGSVAIVTGDSEERQHYARLTDEALAEIRTTIGHGMLSVITADALEPNDSDSSVVILRRPETRGAAWLHTASGTAARRAVVVSTVQSDYPVPKLQENKSILDGFVTRWRKVTADQDQQCQNK
jgi:hypothetical protein